MLNYKNFVYVVVLITAAACKTSPTNEQSSTSAPPAVTVNSQSATSETSVAPTSKSQPSVVSSADTGSNVDSEKPIYNIEPGDFNLYPREMNGWDESGWSIITPSDDSRLIYVSSSSGDDETAEFYLLKDLSDVENPGLIKPFSTIEAASVHARTGYPDWILLRQGDSWEIHDLILVKSGRSARERSVITSYGQSGERPIIKSDAIEAFRIWSNRYYIAITGIEFYAYKRDPDSLDFSGWGQTTDSTGIRVYSPEDSTMGTILLEGNTFNYLSKGISITGGGDVIDVVIRRNIIRNSYSENSHSQGIFAQHTSALLEENIFDHNGWYKQQVDSGNERSEGQANMFNHNTYFAKSFSSKFIRNIFLRPSSIHNKWTANSDSDSKFDSISSEDLWMEDNLYVGGEIGISAGGNADHGNGPRWKNITIINNVMLAIGRDQPTNRTLGWNIDASDWEGGLICGNYVLHTDNPLVTNLLGIRLEGHSSDVTIADNTIHGLFRPVPSSKTGAITIDSDPKANIIISGNNIQLTEGDMRVIFTDQLDSISFQGNRYFSALEDNSWFYSNGISHGIDSWREISGDISSTVGADSFIEPKRTFETYLLSIGLSESIADFSHQAANQSKSNWSLDLTAQSVINYIREGYGSTKCSKQGPL